MNDTGTTANPEPDPCDDQPGRERAAAWGQQRARRGVIAIACAYLALALSRNFGHARSLLGETDHIALLVTSIVMATAGGLSALGGWLMLFYSEHAPATYFTDGSD